MIPIKIRCNYKIQEKIELEILPKLGFNPSINADILVYMFDKESDYESFKHSIISYMKNPKSIIILHIVPKGIDKSILKRIKCEIGTKLILNQLKDTYVVSDELDFVFDNLANNIVWKNRYLL